MLIEIPLLKKPNQELTVSLNQQNTILKLKTFGKYMYADIYLSNVLQLAGMRCVHGSYLNQYSSDFLGYLFFFNDNQKDPAYKNIGKSVHLLYADYDILKDGYRAT